MKHKGLSSRTKRLLEEHCRYMERVQKAQGDEHFCMASFLEHSGVDHEHFDTERPLAPRDLNTCGTTACSMGHFAVSPAGRRLGVAMYVARIAGMTEITDVFKLNGRYKDPFDIAEHVFGLTHRQTTFLFGGRDLIKSPEEWAGMCRAFIALDGDIEHPLLRGFELLEDAVNNGAVEM